MRGGCLVPVIGLFCPRLVMVVLFLTTNWFECVFETAILPLLGFAFMPYTTLSYTWATMQTNGNIHGEWFLLICIALLFDMGTIGHTTRSRS